ncbi:MAG: MBL fold metallo-hydrolase [Deltaproteobacteria bacterium]|nr:MBL fold metallo-hydrolase [Deltaproteobacteria bacterium]
MDLVFLGTGGAWGLPELNCTCRICVEMRLRQERRLRTALLLSGRKNLLIDCGPDIAAQLSRHPVERIDGVLLTHEHGDHYLGLDDLSAYKRTRIRGEFQPIPLFVTSGTWQTVGPRFGYLEETGVLCVQEVKPGKAYVLGDMEFVPFKTNHGSFAAGSVGYLIRFANSKGQEERLVYTSDFVELPEFPEVLRSPHYLIIQSYWLNEPAENRPNHMSFQRALDFIRLFAPQRETFLVHIGDGDFVPGDPANAMMKKARPMRPLRPPPGGEPYPVPLHHSQWQEVVNRVADDYRLPSRVTVAHDGLRVEMGND